MGESRRLSWATSLAAKTAVTLTFIAVLQTGISSDPLRSMGFQPIGGAVQAQSDKIEKRRQRRQIPGMTEETFKKLGKIQKAMEEDDDPQAALKIVRDLLRRPKLLNGNELAQVHKMAGWINFSLNNIPATIAHYEAILVDREAIPEALEQGTVYNLSQIYFNQEEYKTAIELMIEWMDLVVTPNAQSMFFIAAAYTRLEDWDNAMDYGETAVRLQKGAGKTVRKNWYDLLNLIYYEKELYAKCVEVLEIMVVEYPSKKYWRQLSAMYGQINEPNKQIGALEVAHAGGYLDDESSLRQYVQFLMHAEAYSRSFKYFKEGFESELVESNLKNLDILGKAYMASLERDRAIEVFSEASALSDDGKIAKNLASLFLSSGRFDECVSSGAEALEKGGISYPYRTRMIVGSCNIEMDRLTKARSDFVEARREANKAKTVGKRDKKRHEASALQCSRWIAYIDNELKRLDALAELSQ